MTGGGPKTKADEIARQDYLTRRNNELREGEDAYDEAANLTVGELDTRNPDCVRCYGSGWVCENHPHRVWRAGPYYEEMAGDSACECGAGMPCPDCNDLSKPTAKLLVRDSAKKRRVTGANARKH